MVKHISTILASSYVLESIKLETTDKEDAWITKLKNDAMKMLDEICSGTSILFDSSGNEITPNVTAGIISNTSSYQPIFNEGDARDWEVSEGKKEDEDDKYDK